MSIDVRQIRPQIGDRIEITDVSSLVRYEGVVIELRPMFTDIGHKPTGSVAAKVRTDDGQEYLSAQRWSEEFVLWTDDDGRPRYVPMTAPYRIVALATLRNPASRVVTRLPDGAESWHPQIDS